jgi:hypothetical protein
MLLSLPRTLRVYYRQQAKHQHFFEAAPEDRAMTNMGLYVERRRIGRNSPKSRRT